MSRDYRWPRTVHARALGRPGDRPLADFYFAERKGRITFTPYADQVEAVNKAPRSFLLAAGFTPAEADGAIRVLTPEARR